jgi:hypothetical protein
LSRRRPITAQSLLQHFHTNHPEVSRCKHNPSNSLTCIERSKISWDHPDYVFAHFRFDGCICCDTAVKKCDCIIFRLGQRGEKPIMFVVETKKKRPSFSTAKCQLETGIQIMIQKLPEPKSRFFVIPVLFAQKITGHIKEIALHNRVIIFGKKELVRLRKYGQNINDLV